MNTSNNNQNFQSYKIGNYIIEKERQKPFQTNKYLQGQENHSKKQIFVHQVNKFSSLSPKQKQELENQFSIILKKPNSLYYLKPLKLSKTSDNAYLVYEGWDYDILEILETQNQTQKIHSQKEQKLRQKMVEYLIENTIKAYQELIISNHLQHLNVRPWNIILDQKFYIVKLKNVLGRAKKEEEKKNYLPFPILFYKTHFNDLKSQENRRYIAPELRQNPNLEEKGIADIYSLGVIFYRMIFGEFPEEFHLQNNLLLENNQENVNEFQFSAIMQNIIQNSEVKINSHLVKLVLKMLHFDPEKRASWNEIFKYLQRDQNIKFQKVEEKVLFLRNKNSLQNSIFDNINLLLGELLEDFNIDQMSIFILMYLTQEKSLLNYEMIIRELENIIIQIENNNNNQNQIKSDYFQQQQQTLEEKEQNNLQITLQFLKKEYQDLLEVQNQVYLPILSDIAKIGEFQPVIEYNNLKQNQNPQENWTLLTQIMNMILKEHILTNEIIQDILDPVNQNIEIINLFYHCILLVEGQQNQNFRFSKHQKLYEKMQNNQSHDINNIQDLDDQKQFIKQFFNTNKN